MDVRVVFHKSLDPDIPVHKKVLVEWGLGDETDEDLREIIQEEDLVQINLRVNGELLFLIHGFVEDEPTGIVIDFEAKKLVDLDDIDLTIGDAFSQVKNWYDLVTNKGLDYEGEFWYAD